MRQTRLAKFFDTFFDKYVNIEPIFRDRRILTDSYIPETMIHREEQVKQLATILAPSLRFQKPSNAFLYGKTGTGKTLTAKYVSIHLELAAAKHKVPIKIVYTNCKMKKVSDTEYRAISNLVRQLGGNVPSTGLPLDELYKILFDLIDKRPQIVIVILDEIDYLIRKAGDEVLYNFTRINSELVNSQVSIVGISNSLTFVESLDPRVKSSLSEEDIIFPPYNAYQLLDILRERAKLAFREGAIASGVIEKIAAIAAREHGDARRALDLLRISGEIAEREGASKVTLEHVDKALKKLEIDKVIEVVRALPKQAQVVLLTLIKLYREEKKKVFTGDLYDEYVSMCNNIGYPSLTQRRISEIISELDLLGIINAKTVNRGKYGRTREISLAISEVTINKIERLLSEILFSLR